MDVSDRTLMCQLYCILASKQLPDVRRWCAFNFPVRKYNYPSITLPKAVVSVTQPQSFEELLKTTFLSLATDLNPSVRRAIASGVHEVRLNQCVHIN